MRRPSPALVISIIALFVALGGVGVAANGGSFILGQSNSATSTSSLSAPVAGGKALQLTNSDTSNAASTALGLNVASGHTPFTVNSTKKVTNLNADLLDGRDSSYFLPTTGTAANANALNGFSSSYFLPATGTAANSSELGGNASSYYVRGWTYVVGSRTIGGNVTTINDIAAVCPTGTKVLGGGWDNVPDFAGIYTDWSAPYGQADGWEVAVQNRGSTSITVYVWAICAYVS